MEKGQKIFMWYATSAYGNMPWAGPHYVQDIKKIGKKAYHSLEDLLKMDISDAKKRKLEKATPGSKITLHNLHANGDLMLKCLSTEQVEQLKNLEKLNKRKELANKKAKQLKSEYDTLFSKLLKIK